jgi:prenyltransferase beta subunit
MDRVNDILNNLQESVSNEHETMQQELQEYKKDFYEMSMGSIKAIATHANSILKAIEDNNSMIKENLTESWLQGKIAITEDYMRTIHDFVMFVSDDSDDTSVEAKQGLWDNIRKKKEKEGKNYKPAKRGDKDRPDPDQWKKLTKNK